MEGDKQGYKVERGKAKKEIELQAIKLLVDKINPNNTKKTQR